MADEPVSRDHHRAADLDVCVSIRGYYNQLAAGVCDPERIHNRTLELPLGNHSRTPGNLGRNIEHLYFCNLDHFDCFGHIFGGWVFPVPTEDPGEVVYSRRRLSTTRLPNGNAVDRNFLNFADRGPL